MCRYLLLLISCQRQSGGRSQRKANSCKTFATACLLLFTRPFITTPIRAVATHQRAPASSCSLPDSDSHGQQISRETFSSPERQQDTQSSNPDLLQNHFRSMSVRRSLTYGCEGVVSVSELACRRDARLPLAVRLTCQPSLAF